MDFIVTRHQGALDWIRQRLAEPSKWLPHLTSLRPFRPGDTVYGNLPVHQVALLNRAGVAYVHLCVDIPAHLRGMELSAGQLEALGARLQKFRVEPVDSV